MYGAVMLRSYLAGEWEVVGDNKVHDGLRQLFLFFVDNRDASTGGRRGGMKVSPACTASAYRCHC